VGLLEMVRDGVDRRGRPKPLYVNLVCHLAPKLVRALPGDRALVRPTGQLEVTRVPAER
jgi:hypothetical protein